MPAFGPVDNPKLGRIPSAPPNERQTVPAFGPVDNPKLGRIPSAVYRPEDAAASQSRLFVSCHLTPALEDGILAQGMAANFGFSTPGALYEVMKRGDCRESIFHDDDDHRWFIDLLRGACGRRRV